MARRIGITGSALSQIERGRVRPSIGTLLALCGELELQLDDLLGLAPHRRSRMRIARRGFRKTAEIRHGVRWSPVVGDADGGSQLLQLELQPGAIAEAAGLPLRPTPQELFLFVTAGTLRVRSADGDYQVSAGDSLVVGREALRSIANDEADAARVVLAVVAERPEPPVVTRSSAPARPRGG